jgi:membrane protease YdiL (CAAX protease family)
VSLLTAAKEYVDNSVHTAIDRTNRVVTGIQDRVSGVLRSGVDRINKETFVRLLGGGLLGVLAVLPYQLSLIEEQQIGIPLPLIVIQALFFNGIIVGAAVFVGLACKDRVGFSVFDPRYPIRSTTGIISNYGPPVALGGISAGVLVVLDALAFSPRIESAGLATLTVGTESTPVWSGLLASLYGGITEEILLRLGFMTLAVWTIAKLGRVEGESVTGTSVWGAIVFTSIVFGLGHLPTTAMTVDLTPMIVARALVLNGIPGLVFGYCYWQQDLTAAMAAHLSADLVLHVITPLLS